MDEKTAAIVEKLADKLGVTAEHMWGVLVRQAPISSATDLLIVCAMWVAIWRGWVFVRSLDRGSYDSAYEPAFVGMLVLSGFVVIITLVAASGIVWGFVSPEYWALMQILKK